MWVSPLTNEEPLVVVKTCIDIVREVVRKDGSDGRGGVIWKGETSLRRGGSGSIREGGFGAENGDVSHGWNGGSHRRSEVLTSGGGDKHVVGIDSDVFVKRGEKESVKYFLGYAGRCGRHG